MNPWTVLGIAPTTDVRTILRAYAQKLRATRPEDDPDGFQRLMEARERALAWRPEPAATDDEREVEVDGEADAPPSATDETMARGAPLDAVARETPPRWRAPTTMFEAPDPRAGAPPRWRAPPPPPARPDETSAPPPQRALGGGDDHDALTAFRARLAVLAGQPDPLFRDLAAWREILDLADLLSLSERESARNELAAKLVERLPDAPPGVLRHDAGLIALVDRLDRDFDLVRVANDVKRLGEGPQRTRLADWLNACAAERALARRRAGGPAAHRLPSGLPLIPPEDRWTALARSDLVAIYEALARGGPMNWPLAWRGALLAVVLPGAVAAARDAARLSLLALALEIGALGLAIASASHVAAGGADAVGRIENLAALAVLIAARVAVMSLWPRFAIRRAAARVRRADRAGLATPAGRRLTLSRRLSARAFSALAAFLAGFVDLIASVGTAGTFLAAFNLAS